MAQMETYSKFYDFISKDRNQLFLTGYNPSCKNKFKPPPIIFFFLTMTVKWYVWK